MKNKCLILIIIFISIAIINCGGDIAKPDDKPSSLDSAIKQTFLFSSVALNNAITYFAGELKSEPKSADLNAHLSRAYSLLSIVERSDEKKFQKDLEEAAKYARIAFELSTSSSWVFNANAHLNMLIGRYTSAEVFANKAIELDNKNSDNYYILWLITENTKPNVDLLKKASDLNKGHVNARNAYSFNLMKSNQFNQSIEQLKDILSSLPNDVLTLSNYGLCYALQKNFTEAQKYLKKALEINPNNSHLRYAIGKYLINKGNYNQAAIQLDRAIKNNPINHHAIIELVNIYNNNLNQPEDAIQVLDEGTKNISDVALHIEYAKYKNSIKGRLKENNLFDVVYEGGNGRSFKNAVEIKCNDDSFSFIQAQHQYIKKVMLENGTPYVILSHTIVEQDGTKYNVITVRLNENYEKKKFYFILSGK